MTAHWWSRLPDETGLRPGTFWVRCSGCGAELVTDLSLFPSRCHEGWSVPEDCDETVVERIMEG